MHPHGRARRRQRRPPRTRSARALLALTPTECILLGARPGRADAPRARPLPSAASTAAPSGATASTAARASTRVAAPTCQVPSRARCCGGDAASLSGARRRCCFWSCVVAAASEHRRHPLLRARGMHLLRRTNISTTRQSSQPAANTAGSSEAASWCSRATCRHWRGRAPRLAGASTQPMMRRACVAAASGASKRR